MPDIKQQQDSNSAREKRVSPLRAIRLKCLDCSGQLINEVRNCTITCCNLWPFRMGRNPNRAGIGNKNPPHIQEIQ
jgi:hypothetical protein